jgi:single-strand DNA-binding protein
MNNIECALIGRVASEAIELKTSQAGKPWARFNAAVGQGDDVQWLQVACFGEIAEHLVSTVRKGDRIYCEGTLRLNSWTDRDGQPRSGLPVAAWKVEKLGQIGRSKSRKPKAPPEGDDPAPPSANGGHHSTVDARDWQRPLDDAIPF